MPPRPYRQINPTSRISSSNDLWDDHKAIYDAVMAGGMGIYGDIWYVDQSVAVSGDGKTWPNAFKTVAEAYTASSNYDVIYIAPGGYDLDNGVDATGLNIDGKKLFFIGSTDASPSHYLKENPFSVEWQAYNNVWFYNGTGTSVVTLLNDAVPVFIGIEFYGISLFGTATIGINGDASHFYPAFVSTCWFSGFSTAAIQRNSGNMGYYIENSLFSQNIIDIQAQATNHWFFIRDCQFMWPAIGAVNSVIVGDYSHIMNCTWSNEDILGAITCISIETIIGGTGCTVIENCKSDYTTLLNDPPGNAELFSDSDFLTAIYTTDIQVAPGNINLFMGNKQNVLIEDIVMYCSRDCSADAGGFTGVSIQTDDTTPQILIPQALGVIANLTQDSQMAWGSGNGHIVLRNGQVIQCTIYGAQPDAPTSCTFHVKYRPTANNGGHL